jgi:hypothetical protein
MAQFGRDEWRRHGEVFSVWFGVLGRLAPFGLAVEPEDGRVVRRPLASALADAAWPTSIVCLLALGTSSILYDGLSQTELFFSAFGLVDLTTGTLLMGVFFAMVLAVVLAVASTVGQRAVGAGLVPVATGYLVAHYLSSLLVDGQRIVIALSDPLQQGWDLFGFAFFQPDASWLSPTVLWTVQLGAVVGGHVVGAWAGHSALTADARGTDRLRQVPLAAMMVALTTATLWSLGQGLVFVDEGEPIGATAGGRMVASGGGPVGMAAA